MAQLIMPHFVAGRVSALAANFNAASVQAQTFNAAQQLLAVQNASAVALAFATNTAAIQAAIAECCCEQKELTRAEANATRDLINSLNTQNINRDLVDAKTEIQLLKIKSATVTS